MILRQREVKLWGKQQYSSAGRLPVPVEAGIQGEGSAGCVHPSVNTSKNVDKNQLDCSLRLFECIVLIV